MRVGVVTASTYVAMLVLLFYFAGHDCKKKKSSFTFEALMAGMNSKEKEMFKEELNKEVKKFRASQQKHHKQKAIVRKPPKKHKVKDKLPKFLPGICDPICAHQCVHGCDFRCCIPDYQQLHKIPRPPPMVVLPGSCSPTCSPTCRPLCTEKCCEGGPGGMFQSSKDLITLDTQSCPEGCSKDCMPRCVISCCVQHMPSYVPAPRPGAPQTKETSTPGQLTVQPESSKAHDAGAAASQPSVPVHVENSSASPDTQMRHSVEANLRPEIPPRLASAQRSPMQEMQQVRNVQQMNQAPIGPQLEGHIPRAYFIQDIKCGSGCPDFCAPLCQQGCCASAKRGYSKIPVLFKAPQLLPQVVSYQQFKGPMQLRYSAMANQPKAILPLSRANCPVQCFASCKPQCEVRCCTMQHVNPYTRQTSLPEPEVHSRSAFLRPVTVAQLMHQAQMSQAVPSDDIKIVQQPRMGVARKRIQTMESNGGGNYESNIETIHALSKDMISKPEPVREDNASQRNHVETGPAAGNAHKEDDHKRSSFPPAPFHPDLRYAVMSRPFVPRENVPRDVPNDQATKKEILPPAIQQRIAVDAKAAVPHPDTAVMPRQNANNGIAKRIEAKKASLPSVSPPVQLAPKKDNIPPVKKDNTPPVKKDNAAPAKKDDSKPMKKDDMTKPAKKDNSKSVKKDDIKQAKKDGSAPIKKQDTIPTKKDVINEQTHIPSKKIADVKTPDVKKSNIPKNSDGDKKSTISASPKCPHQCSDTCAPECDKPCCNRQIVYEAFHKPQKRAKVKYQLQMLK